MSHVLNHLFEWLYFEIYHINCKSDISTTIYYSFIMNFTNFIIESGFSHFFIIYEVSLHFYSPVLYELLKVEVAAKYPQL